VNLTIQNVESLTLDGTAEGVEDALQSLVAEGSQFSVGDTVRWGSSGGPVRGRVVDVTTDGSFSDRIDGDFTVEGTTENPAYLLMVYRENPDDEGAAWVPKPEGSNRMVGHREDSLSPWEISGDKVADASAMAAASNGADSPFRASVSGANPDGVDDLTGVVWAAGDHTLYLNGKPTPVHVPEDSIPRTFQNVTDGIQAGEPPKLGMDHGNSLHEDTVPVASELDLLTVGQATDFALSEDGRSLVMTDYELTNDKAVDAAQNGQLAAKDYSIVGDLRLHTNDDGQPKTVESGGKERLVVTAETVRQVDFVKTGAVSGAGPGTMPPLQTAASLAEQSPTAPATAYTSSLRAMAKQARERDMKDLTELQDVDDPDAVLEGAAEVVEHKDDRIQRLQAVASAAGVDVDEDAELDELTERAEAVAEQADAAETLADFHDVDLNAEDGVQALVDEHTADLREDVAAKEASLPKYDTDGDSVDDRAEELTGKSPAELQAMNGQRATEILESEQARSEYGKAHASGDGADGDVSGDGGSSGAGDDDVEAVAQSAMTVDEKLDFRSSDHDSAAEFMAEKHDEDPADFVNEDNPAGAFVAATAGGEGEQ